MKVHHREEKPRTMNFWRGSWVQAAGRGKWAARRARM